MAETTAAPPRDLGAVKQLMTMIGTQVRLLVLARKTRALLIVQMIPVVAALIYVVFESVDGLTMFTNVTQSVTIPFLAPLAAIFFGGPAIVEEMEGRTLTYLTLRPVNKVTLFVGKSVSAILVAVPLVVLPVLLLFAICLSQSPDFGEAFANLGPMVGAVALGTTAYTAVFAALGAAFASGLVGSFIYFVVFEMVLATLPVLELTSLRYHVKNTAGVQATDRLGFLDQLVLDAPIQLEWWVSVIILGLVALGATVLGAVVFRERQYYM